MVKVVTRGDGVKVEGADDDVEPEQKDFNVR